MRMSLENFKAAHQSERFEKFKRIVTQSDAMVLLTGATGTGKTQLAQWLHDHSLRKNRPFVSVNLASIHEGTLESELFGHERGAFTSADQRRVGRIELADGGTLFLDEIGELSLKLQSRLLEFLQCRKLCPVGSNRAVTVNCRIIAATHRNLAQMVAQGTFREDLFHRLTVLSYQLPSLIEQSWDFDRVLHEMIESISVQYGKSIRSISPEVAEYLENHSWPGNYRELRNVLEYSVISAESSEITRVDLPEWFLLRKNGLEVSPTLGAISEDELFSEKIRRMSYHEALSLFEKTYIKKNLVENRCRINYTARKIGMAKATLIRRMREYGLYELLE